MRRVIVRKLAECNRLFIRHFEDDRCDGGLVALPPHLVLFQLAFRNPVWEQDFRIAEVVIGDFNTGQARQRLALLGSAHERAARDAFANNFTISTPFVPVPPVIGSWNAASSECRSRVELVL